MEMSDFEQTHQRLASNQRTAEYVMAAQQGKLPEAGPQAKEPAVPKLEKSKTLKAFASSKSLTMDSMKKQAAM